MLAFGDAVHHDAAPPGLCVPAAFVRHGDFGTGPFNLGGKSSTLALQVTVGAAHAVSHGQSGDEARGWKEEKTHGIRQGMLVPT